MKEYNIKITNVTNIREYSVWKHENEEVWEVCDNVSSSSLNLATVKTRQVLEFDWEGSHFRIYPKKEDACNDYLQFTEEDFVLITFMDAETDVTPAATLPIGWNWIQRSKNDETSGFLESPDGMKYFPYTISCPCEEETIEFRTLNNQDFIMYNRDFTDAGHEDGLRSFKEYAETEILKNKTE